MGLGGWPLRIVAALALASVVALGAAGTGHAQVCGDADGDGMVTDTDGVNALRAAAQLSTLCTLDACDVNADGMLTDTDGVLILRIAASLPVAAHCVPVSDDPVDARVALLVERVSPFLENAFDFVPQLTNPASNDVIPCDNFDDGDIEIETDEGETLVTYTSCRLGQRFLDGDVEDGEDGLVVGLTVIEGDEDEDIAFSNESGQLTAVETGMSLRISGLFVAEVFFDHFLLEDVGDFRLFLSNLEVRGSDSNLLSGTARLDLGESEVPGIIEVELRYDGSNIAVVTVTHDDLATTTHLFDRGTNQFL